MRNIIIKSSLTADTRTAKTVVTKKQLHDSSVQHINDVQQCLNVMSDELHDIGLNHDNTKISEIDQFHKDFVEVQVNKKDFTELEWYNYHVKNERHHLHDKFGKDINLFDIMEHIADICMAGMSRSGYVYKSDLSSELLTKAYQNTIDLIIKNTVIKNDK